MRTLASVDYYVLIFYAVLVLGIGVYFSKFMKGAKEYFTGGNMIPWWVAGISLYMGNFSAWTFTGASGFVYHTGLFGVLYFLTWSFAFFIGYRITASKWRRSRVISPVEYTSTRYNVTTQQLVGYVMVIGGILNRGIILTAVSKVISSTVGVPIEYVIIISGSVILLYTLLGGLWAVTITDVVQFIILLAITILVMPLSIKAVGGLESFIHHLPPLKMEHIYGGMKYDVHYLIAITLFNIINANWGAAQRYYSVKDEKDAKRVGLTCSLLFLTVPILFGIPPLAAHMLWPDLSVIDFFSSHIKPEDLVYVGIVLKTIPNGLIGFFLAAMFAATMSTIDTTYNIDSSVISRDLYAGLINPHANDKQILKVGKISTAVLGILAIVMALFYAKSQLGIFNLMVIVIALLNFPVAVPMAFGLVFKKLPRWSAASAVSLGLLVSMVGRFILNWSMGPQMYATAIITFIVLVASPVLANLYKKNKGTLAVVLFGWTIIQFAIFYQGSLSPIKSALFYAAAAVFVISLYLFTHLFANETDEDKSIVERFFERLAKPVDVATEVYGENKRPVSSFPVVGIITMIIGVLIFLLAIGPIPKPDVPIHFVMGGFLLIVGFLMYYYGGKSEKRFLMELQRNVIG